MSNFHCEGAYPEHECNCQGLREDEGLLEEQAILLDPKASRTERILSSKLWIITTTLLAIVVVVQSRMFYVEKNRESYQTGFSTDFGRAKSAIKIDQVRFTGGLSVDRYGNLSMNFDPDGPRYVGIPSPDIDQAWRELIGGLHPKTGNHLHYSQEEAFSLMRDPIAAKPEPFDVDKTFPQGGYYGTISFIHNLHCINAIRMHLDKDYYGSHMNLPPQWERVHMDHCIDQLRQDIMCHADITPMTSKQVSPEKFPGMKLLLTETERLHTCRNPYLLRDAVMVDK